jgi:UDP-galactose transporter B1
MKNPKVLTAGGAASSSIKYANSPMRRTLKRSQQVSPMRRTLKKPESESSKEEYTSEARIIEQDSNSVNLSVSESVEDDDDISFEDEQEEELVPLNKGEDSNCQLDDLYATDEAEYEVEQSLTSTGKLVWLAICFFGIMLSFVGYGILLEYATSDGRKLHELSFLFVTSLLYTVTAAAGRYVRDETPTTIPPARFAVLGITSMGSTFCSVRSLRYVSVFFHSYKK